MKRVNPFEDRSGAIQDEKKRLNTEQLQVVNHIAGPVLVLAGAGTGKTRVIAVRAGSLISDHKIPPERMMVVTFTVKAVDEVRERIQQIAGSKGRRVLVGTFHSLGYRQLNEHPEIGGYLEKPKPAEDYRLIKFIDEIVAGAADVGSQLLTLIPDLFSEADESIKLSSEGLKDILSEIARAKDRGLGPDDYVAWVAAGSPSEIQEAAALVYPHYQDMLRENSLCDFGDMLLWPVKAMSENEVLREKWAGKYSHIMVDEFQDTSPVQQEWLRYMAQDHLNICCVGDDDQAIFGFRGADSSLILRFEEEYAGAKIAPSVITFRTNYRCSGRILAAANAVIGNNKYRRAKSLTAENPEGEKVRIILSMDDEQMLRRISLRASKAEQDGAESVFILIRSNFMARPIEEALIRQGLSYELVGGDGFYAREEIKDLVAWLRLLHVHDEDMTTLRRVINKPARGLGMKTLEALEVAYGDFIQKAPDSDPRARRGILSTLFELIQDNQVEDLSDKGRQSFLRLMATVQAYRQDARPIGERLEDFLDAYGYLEYWRENQSSERLENIAEYCENANGVDDASQLIEMADRADKANSPDALIKIMTSHRSKGLEADLVLAPYFQEGHFPTKKAVEAALDGRKLALEDERKLAYVTFTRARHQLEIHYAGTLSRFAEEVPAELVQFGEEPAQHSDDGLSGKLQAFLDAANQKGAQFPDWADLDIADAGSADKWSGMLGDQGKVARLKTWALRCGLEHEFKALENAYSLRVQINRTRERLAG